MPHARRKLTAVGLARAMGEALRSLAGVVEVRPLSARELEALRPRPAAPDRLLRVREVMTLTGLGRTTLWQLERDGGFPKRRPLTKRGRAVGWRASEVAAWVSGCYITRRVDRG
jgi:prophage regulatory protein